MTPNRPKPPLGWPPWETPTPARRVGYVFRNRLWRLRSWWWNYRYAARRQ